MNKYISKIAVVTAFVSFSFFTSCNSDDDNAQEDKNKLLYEASILAHDEDADYYEDKLEMIRNYVDTLPKSMQEIFDLIYIQELTQAQVCVKLGLSKSTVSERVKTLNKKIKEYFSKKPEL